MCRHNTPWAHVYCTMNQWPTGHVQTQQSMGSCLLYNESVANWACADTTIHGLMFIVQWISGQLGMCRHNNPWAHVYCTMNQWPTGHVQTQQSMGTCLLYNESVANWACADTTIHGLMFIVQWISGQLGMCRHNNPWAHVYCTMNQWPTGHVQTKQSMGSCLLYNESVANWACAHTTIHGLMFTVQWISGQLGMCRHNNPWAHVYCTMNEWPTGHVQTQQSMGSCLLYNESVANWACADTTIHGLMLIVQWVSGQLGMCRQQSMGSCLLYNESVANWACADTTIHGLMLIVQWVSSQLGMCRHNNPWAHVNCTMSQWPTGHVQTTIHGLMLIVQWISGQLGMCRHNNPWAHVYCTMNQWPTGHVQTQQSMDSFLHTVLFLWENVRNGEEVGQTWPPGHSLGASIV